ncbi:cell cycle histidine kinase CckA [Caulobacter mirabilis]|uniref:histidine kinase n=1 Tax=Caulobacter mirabilis TaxID=69666 RepID=A0A2D2AVK0_9CAUL|nr:ATP-binding protein [Caulobacter mirabilis]ATQ41987.1 hybrid sensor histidine kinase/response regulator [Caulobacter mirabilis]
MAEPTPAEPRERRFDPWIWGAGACFVLALGLASVPAWKHGPSTLAGMLLLVGLAGVALLGILGLRGSASTVELDEDGAETFVEALPEAAAVTGADGRLHASNTPWREALGGQRRLPRNGPAAPGLFAALTKARKGQIARAAVRLGGEDRPLIVSSLGAGRFLVRLEPAVTEPLRLTAELPAAVAAAGAAPPVLNAAPKGPATLDALAAASPFGAAMLEGEEVFSAAIVEANAALSAMTAGKAVAGRTFGDLIDPHSRIDAGLGSAEGRAGPIEVRLAHDPSRIAHLYLARTGGRLTAYLVDVTEQKQIELQLAQSQKMQAIGQLAAGIAHDFNNLLTAIQLRLDELLERHPLGDPSYEGLTSIKGTAARAADLVRKLKTYSRQETLQREVLDLGETISDFEVLLRRLLREPVKLDTDYGRDLPLVKVDKGQLEIAVMNLVLNAQDALISAKGGGRIALRTGRVGQTEAVSLGYAGAPVGDLAMIEVRDDGPGIPNDVLGKIFDPFFTTKAVGEGTGLGLAQVYGIVKQSEGWIHVESPAGEGATFRIFLPVHTPSAAAPRPAPQPAATLARPRAARDLSGVGRILFVEDEEAVRGIAASLLRKRGYEVIEAGDGEQALVLAEEHAGTIDLLISDVMMPGMDGPTLLKKARHHLGDAPVMFISGYAEAEFSDLLEGETGVSFLPKPLDIKTLAERVKQQLQAA